MWANTSRRTSRMADCPVHPMIAMFRYWNAEPRIIAANSSAPSQ